jgi:hypothetical protein
MGEAAVSAKTSGEREPRRRTSAFRLVRPPFSSLHSTLCDYEVIRYIRNAIGTATDSHILRPAITKVIHWIINYAQITQITP